MRFRKSIFRQDRIYLREGQKKYTDDELLKIIKNESTPVFVYDDEGILGYVFCIIKEE